MGLTDAQWRARGLRRVTRSVRATVELATLADRCRAFALALPDDVVFSHLTAARLWDLPLPRWAEECSDLDVLRETARPAIERRGCRGHRGLEARGTAQVRGLPVTSLADTWVDLAEVRRPRTFGVDDLVVLADVALMHWATVVAVAPGEEEWQAVSRWEETRIGVQSRPDHRDRLRAALDARTRPRGAVRLRQALADARVGSRSPMETRSRLLVVRAGLPEPELNVAISGHGGWLLEGDLVWRRERVIAEYQGEHHGGRRRRSMDEARRALAEDEAWTVVEIYAEDHHHPPRRRALLRRLAGHLGVDPASLELG